LAVGITGGVAVDPGAAGRLAAGIRGGVRATLEATGVLDGRVGASRVGAVTGSAVEDGTGVDVALFPGAALAVGVEVGFGVGVWVSDVGGADGGTGVPAAEAPAGPRHTKMTSWRTRTARRRFCLDVRTKMRPY
jgi:hypothetical protein